MKKTKIDWAERVWNPVTGCTKVSEGCRNCYAERHAKRFWGDRKFTEVLTHPERLGEPLKLKKPSLIFVNSMSDLFHDDVPDAFITAVFDIAHDCPKHIFLILTKRPERMAKAIKNFCLRPHWNFSNVWFGVSVEDQKTADERIPELLKLPTLNLFVSVEPLLGAIDLNDLNYAFDNSQLDCLVCEEPLEDCPTTVGTNTIKWVIVGGESGPNARPMHPEWVRSIRDQCQSANVTFFFKQWGEWSPLDLTKPPKHVTSHDAVIIHDFIDGRIKYCGMDRIGKTKAGHLLDGKEYREYPEALKLKGDKHG